MHLKVCTEYSVYILELYVVFRLRAFGEWPSGRRPSWHDD